MGKNYTTEGLRNQILQQNFSLIQKIEKWIFRILSQDPHA